jgi:chromosome segregation ATPase
LWNWRQPFIGSPAFIGDFGFLITSLDSKVIDLPSKFAEVEIKVSKIDRQVSQVYIKVSEIDGKVRKVDRIETELDRKVDDFERTRTELDRAVLEVEKTGRESHRKCSREIKFNLNAQKVDFVNATANNSRISFPNLSLIAVD